MIQFNLLPAVKQEYVRTQHQKRLVVLIAASATAVALVIFIALFIAVRVVQKNYSASLTEQIKTETSKLEGTTDLNKILTIQNQLASLPALHDQKPVTTRLLGYMKQVTPAKVSVASMDIDFVNQTMSITGSADAISTVNKFVDTLKFTSYSIKYGESEPKINCTFKELSYNEDTRVQTCIAFSAVVLSSFGRDTKGASYQLSLIYDPNIFSASSEVNLLVPTGKITTRSETEKPEALFQPLSNPSEVSQ